MGMGSSSSCCNAPTRSTTPTKNHLIKQKKDMEILDSNIYSVKYTSLVDEAILSSKVFNNKFDTIIKKSRSKENVDLANPQLINNILVKKNEETKKKVQELIKGELRGKGRLGIVYSGLSASGKKYALKYYYNITYQQKKYIYKLENKILKFQHPNIIKTIQIDEIISTKNNQCLINKNEQKYNFCVINEFCGGMSLNELVGKFGIISDEVIRKYTKQIVDGLRYLHSNGIIHKNLTPKNILLDSIGTIKISDYFVDGIIMENGKEFYNKLIDEKQNKNKNINYYIPNFFISNIIKNNNYEIDQSFDLFCLGCILIEMSCGKFIYDDKKHFETQIDFINYLIEENKSPVIPSSINFHLKHLIQLLFNPIETQKKEIYNKILNLDFFINPIIEEKSKIKSFSNSQISYLNNDTTQNQLGQVLQKNKVINLLNKNENASFSISESDPSSIVQSKLISITPNANVTLRKVFSNNDKSLSLFNSLVNMKSVIEENPNEKSIGNNIDFGTISEINRENESLN